MKKFLISSVFFLSFTFLSNAFGEPNVSFFPHNGANIEEFSKGRELVNKLIGNILSEGFIPKFDKLKIGIAPMEMSGGAIVEDEGVLYVSVTVSEEVLERRLLKFFELENATFWNVSYFLHNEPTIDEFFYGMDKVFSILMKIQDAGFVMTIDELKIGIAPREMSGGAIVEEDGELFISITATEDSLERKFLKFFKLENATFGKVTYFMHNGPTIEEFVHGIGLVETVLMKIRNTGFVMTVDELEIGLAPREMSGGVVVEDDGVLFVSITTTEDTLERKLLKFFTWPN